MLKKVIENKKILIGLLIALFAIIVVAAYMFAGDDSENSKKTPTSNIEVESEEGLDVVGEDENIPEEESDTSDFWEDDKSDKKQNEKNQNKNEDKSGNTTNDNEKSDSDKSEDKSQTDKNETDDKTDDTDKIDKDKEVENGDVSNGEVLKDETTWGEIY